VKSSIIGFFAAVSVVVITPVAVRPTDSAGPGVHILAGESISATVPPTGGDLVVQVLNATSAKQTVTVAVVGLPNQPESSGRPADSFSEELGAREERGIRVRVPVEEPGTYVGSVIAFGSDGTSDARQLALTVSAPSSAAPGSAAPGALALPLPPKLVMSADLLWPTPLTDLRFTWLGKPVVIDKKQLHFVNVPTGPVSIPVDTSVASKISTSVLISPEGRRAKAAVADGRLVISGLEGSGQYDGTVAVGAGTDQKTVPISVVARDNILWALLALAAGLWLAGQVNDYLSRIRPRNALRVLLADLRVAAVDLQDQERAWWSAPAQAELRTFLGAAPVPYAVYDPAAALVKDQGALALDSNEGLTLFDETGSPEDRAKRYARDGAGYQAIEGDVAKLRAIYAAVHKLGTTYRSVTFPEAGDVASFSSTPTAQRARSAMQGRLLVDHGDVETTASDLGSVLELLSRFADLAAFYDEILAAAKGKPNAGAQEISDARAALFSAGNTTLDSFDEVDKTLNAAWAAVVPNIVRRATPEGMAQKSAVDDGHIQERLKASTPAPAMPAELRRDLKRADRIFDALAGVLTIASGLSLVYFARPTFGGTADYLAAFVWGTATKEVLTLLRRLGPFTPT
jgi:hypothetical protein